MLIETVPEFQLKAKYRRKKPKSCARYPSCWRQPFTVRYHKLGPATLLLSNLGHVLSWKMSSTGKRKFWFSFLPAVQSWPLPKEAPLHPYRQSASVSMPFPTQLTRTSTSSSSFPFSFWSHGMWILGSPTRDQTFTPCSGRWILNHWTTKGVPGISFFKNTETGLHDLRFTKIIQNGSEVDVQLSDHQSPITTGISSLLQDTFTLFLYLLHKTFA